MNVDPRTTGELRRRVHAGPYGAVTVSACLARRPSTGAGITVAFVHGLGASHTVWDRLVNVLPGTVHAWVLGLPWDATQGYAWALTHPPQVWLGRALRLLPEPPDVIVAHSFGANVTLDHLVTRRVPAIDGLVLLSPFYRASPETFTWAVISHYLNDFTDMLAAGILARSATPTRADVVTAMAEKVRERIGPYGWMRMFELFIATPVLDLAAITVPCLVVGGERDTASYPEDNRVLAGRLRRGEVEILPGSGHFTMVDATGRVAELVTDFISGRRRDRQ